MDWKWEEIDNRTERAMVPGGWLVRYDAEVSHDTQDGFQSGWDWRPTMAFVPDPNHEWTIEKEGE